MAISGNHYRLLKEHAHLFKRGGSLLEIGEANWYGDEHPSVILEGKDECDLLTVELLHRAQKSGCLFTVVKAAYHRLFAPSIVEAVDMGGQSSMKQDLNGVLKLPRKYDVVMNHGTAEHIFSIAQVFYSMHHATLAGGYMVHDAPLNPLDHGFYCLQPGLFYDLAAANDYELISISVYWIGGPILRFETRDQFAKIRGFDQNALLYVVFRKANDAPFKIPIQGVYGGGLSEAGVAAWEANR